MATRQHDHRAVPRTLFGVLIALLCSQAGLLAQAPERPQLEFHGGHVSNLPENNPQRHAGNMPHLEFHEESEVRHAAPSPWLMPPRPPEQNVPLEFAPTAPVGQVPGYVGRLGFEQVVPSGPGPLFEYCPMVEVIQQLSYVEPQAVAPIETAPTAETQCIFCAPRPFATPRANPTDPCGPPSFWQRWGSWCKPVTQCADGCTENGLVACQRLCGGLHECLCCPDPCYEPRWQPLVDSAFDVASVRPKTQQRFRWDAGMNLNLPDRAEFFWARADGKGRGPTPAAGALLASNRIQYNDFSYYFEAAIEKFALIVQVPYRSVEPTDYARATGLGDVKFGAKSVIFDCELLQIGTQFLVYTPTGNANRGLGTGHYSLEPSLLFGLRVASDTYVQGQISEWIPVHGDQDYAGAVLHTHVALNHELFRLHADWPVIGTFGANTWTFQDGAYTDPLLGSNQKAGGFTYCTIGPGVRLFICDRIDFGVAVQFAVTHPHFAEQLYSTEFRWRF